MFFAYLYMAWWFQSEIFDSLNMPFLQSSRWKHQIGLLGRLDFGKERITSWSRQGTISCSYRRFKWVTFKIYFSQSDFWTLSRICCWKRIKRNLWCNKQFWTPCASSHVFKSFFEKEGHPLWEEDNGFLVNKFGKEQKTQTCQHIGIKISNRFGKDPIFDIDKRHIQCIMGFNPNEISLSKENT